MVSLPLIERAREDGVTFLLSGLAPRTGEERLYEIAPLPPESLIPSRALQPGEQYRFHFDMTKCIGCKCCVVACNEQNGNPADDQLAARRRNRRRLLSRHPALLPLDGLQPLPGAVLPDRLSGRGLHKDPVTGIVLHSADACIGCQYCTWNCSYGVPQYNPERGVVGKCDMCHGRLSDGTRAGLRQRLSGKRDSHRDRQHRRVEAGLRAQRQCARPALGGRQHLHHAHHAAGESSARHQESVIPSASKPEHPHWPLVFMTVLTQLSVGAFAAIWLLQLLGASARLSIAALGFARALAALALGASTLHLGRPIHAYRALKMWRRSWLSREVLMLRVFSGMPRLYAGSLLLEAAGERSARRIDALLPARAASRASACIYLVPARPAWNSSYTIAEFFLDRRCCWARCSSRASAQVRGRLLILIAVAAARRSCSITRLQVPLADALGRFELPRFGAAALTVLASRFLLRGALADRRRNRAAAACHHATLDPAAALAAALAGEILGRYLFFVSVVPKNMAASYVASGKAAA